MNRQKGGQSASPLCLLVVLSNMSMASSTWEGDKQQFFKVALSLATRHIA